MNYQSIIFEIKDLYNRYNRIKVYIRTTQLELEERYRYLRNFRTITYILNNKDRINSYSIRKQCDDNIQEIISNSNNVYKPTTNEIRVFISDHYNFGNCNLLKINICKNRIRESRLDLLEYNREVKIIKNRIKLLQRCLT